MSNITEITGNIFTSECQTLVNTVNCQGVMGAGIALEFRLRLPTMYDRYVEHCQKGHIDIGKLWLYKPPAGAREHRWVLNFPTKRHWRYPSRIGYLEAGLAKFVASYRSRGIESVAFPILGSDNGGLDEADALSVMWEYLEPCDIPIEIYHYDPATGDDVYETFRLRVLRECKAGNLAEATGLRRDLLQKVVDTLGEANGINSLSQLASVKGIGHKTLTKCFRYIMDKQEPVNATGPVSIADSDKALPSMETGRSL